VSEGGGDPISRTSTGPSRRLATGTEFYRDCRAGGQRQVGRHSPFRIGQRMQYREATAWSKKKKHNHCRESNGGHGIARKTLDTEMGFKRGRYSAAAHGRMVANSMAIRGR